jgi:hypothetical protein
MPTKDEFNVGDRLVFLGGEAFAAKKGALVEVTRAPYKLPHGPGITFIDVVWLDALAGGQHNSGYDVRNFRPVAIVLPFDRKKATPSSVEDRQLKLLL